MSLVIVLLRHAEKPNPSTGGEAVDAKGRADTQGLSVRGWQRAGALAALFGGRCATARPGMLARPDVMFAAEDPGRSHRPHDTLLPLAELLELQIRPLPSNGDQGEAARQLLRCAGTVLVSWRHRELPPLARALLPEMPQQVPAVWDERRFDLFWVIASSRLIVVPQLLLAGDQVAEVGSVVDR